MARNKRNARPRKRITKVDNRFKISLIIIFVILCLLVTLLWYRNYQTDLLKISKSEETQNQISKIFENEDYNQISGEIYENKNSVINIIAFGNILYNHELYENIYENNTGIYLFYDYLNCVRKYISSADYSIANLGVNFSGDYLVKEGNSNAPEDLAIAIKNLGINFVNTATKYSNDEGTLGIIKTLEKLDSLKIEHTGTSRAKIENLTPVISDIRGIKVGFLSYTNELNKKLENENNYMVNTIKKEKIIEDIKKIRENGAEAVIINLNGNEIPNIENELISNGANVILENNYNNNTGKIERLTNEKGENVLILHNTGNFIELAKDKNERFSLLYNIEITKNVDNNNIDVSNITYKIFYVHDKGEQEKNRYVLVDVEQEKERFEHNLSKNITDEEYKIIEERLKEF